MKKPENNDQIPSKKSTVRAMILGFIVSFGIAELALVKSHGKPYRLWPITSHYLFPAIMMSVAYGFLTIGIMAICIWLFTKGDD